MPVLLVANPKGGAGKSTLATNVAGYLASRGHAVMLGGRRPAAVLPALARLRPPQARPIGSWEAAAEGSVLRPPRGTTHAVLDTPAGLHAGASRRRWALADKVLVPLQPSIFDIYATREFIDRLLAQRQGPGRRSAWVGMRVGMRTLPRTSCANSSPGWACGDLRTARHAELRAIGRAGAHAVRRGAGARAARPGAVGAALRLAGCLTGEKSPSRHPAARPLARVGAMKTFQTFRIWPLASARRSP